MKNIPFISVFEAFSPLIFLRFSEVGFSPFRDFPGLIIIRKKGLLKFFASETVINCNGKRYRKTLSF